MRRLEAGDFSGLVERINLERELVTTLTGGCQKSVAGYTMKREYVNVEFSAGIENIGFDAIEGLHSPIFIRTVKLKDFPWNGWLMLGIGGEPAAAWNPIGGMTDPFGRLMGFAVADPALLPSPYEAGWMLNRIADVPVANGPMNDAQHAAMSPSFIRMCGLRAGAVIADACSAGRAAEVTFVLRIANGRVPENMRRIRVKQNDVVKLQWSTRHAREHSSPRLRHREGDRAGRRHRDDLYRARHRPVHGRTPLGKTPPAATRMGTSLSRSRSIPSPARAALARRGSARSRPSRRLRCSPTSAAAHGFGQRYDLPIPLSFYLVGTAAAVVVSFVIVGLFVREVPRSHELSARRPARHSARAMDRGPDASRSRSKLVALAVFIITIIAGLPRRPESLPQHRAHHGLDHLAGSASPMSRAFVGNLWALINPWRTIFESVEIDLPRHHAAARACARVCPIRRRSASGPPLLLLLAFAWIELVYPNPGRAARSSPGSRSPIPC